MCAPFWKQIGETYLEIYLENCILHYSQEVLWAMQKCHLLLHGEFKSLWMEQSNTHKCSSVKLSVYTYEALIGFLDIATSSHLELSPRPQNSSGPYSAYSLPRKIIDSF